MTPEQYAREKIDALLLSAGWILQSNSEFNRNASEGVAVREFALPNGPCDLSALRGRQGCRRR